MKNGIYDETAPIIEFANSVKSLGLKWCAGIDLLPLYQGVIAETGNDNRMFVRKAERAGFENTHKLFTALQGAGVKASFARIDIDLFNSLGGISLSFEEQTRMLNAVINGVKAVEPACRIIFNSVDSIDNEKAKKWFNRFQVSGGKGFDIISLSYELNAETFFTLSQNNSFTALLVYVDDIILAGDSLDEFARIKKVMDEEFKIKDLGKLKYFLGIEVAHSKSGISICQRKYCLNLLKDTGLLGSKPISTPCDTSVKLYQDNSAAYEDIQCYRRLV
jgi:hypothetical protein